MNATDNSPAPTPSPVSSRIAGVCLYSAVALAASLHFAMLRAIFNRNFPLATLQSLIDGTAYKPYQFAILVPWLVGQLSALTGVSSALLYQFVEALAVASVILATRYLLRTFVRSAASDILSFGVLLLLPWNYLLPQEMAFFTPSDLPAVAFFTLLLALMARGKWLWYYPLLVVATINRDSSFFIIMVFALTQWRGTPKKKLLAHIAAQLTLWITIKAILSSIYRANPGAAFELYGVGSDVSHLVANLEFLAAPIRALVLFSSFGFIWVALLLWRRHLVGSFIGRTLWVIPAHFAVALVFANLDETRMFGEFIPLVFTAFLIAFARRYNLADRLGVV